MEYRSAFDRLEEITAQLNKQIENDINFLRQTDDMTCKAFDALNHTETDAAIDTETKNLRENSFCAGSLKPWNRNLCYL